MLVTIALSVVVTVIVTVIVLNFSTAEKKVNQRIVATYAITDPQFLRSMGSLLGPGLVGGNRVTLLRNGDEIFPAMLDAIRSAQRTITFETFIYWSGSVGQEFAAALGNRAEAGVKVHLLLDWLGSKKMNKELLDSMEQAGVEIVRYHPLRWYTVTRMNNRTHRKLLIVDGQIGFTGGVGIADHWLGDAEDEDHWRDSHFCAEGPVVAQLQSAFLDNWMQATGQVLHNEDYFPALSDSGDLLAQVFRSDPDEGSESVRLMYMLSIAAARERILISAAYFVPDDLSVDMLVAARERGVRIDIVVPGPCLDAAVVRRASRARWGKLLEAGVAIHEYMPTMYHCKIMVVDGIWSSVGSTNFDTRSFRLNDEANLNVFDRGLAAALTEDFEEDRSHARTITYEEWQQRPLHEKLREHAAALLRSQL